MAYKVRRVNKITRAAKNAKEKVKNKARSAKDAYNREKKKKSFWYYFWTILIGFFILLFLLFIVFAIYIIFSAPAFDPDNLYQKEASVIYDKDGKQIASLGSEKREKVAYEDLPEVLLDAIIATEDSRYFQHNGFDLPRFMKASAGQLLGNSDAGGASTLTMQVVKNNFTSTESSGFAGIVRKFTDIYMSIFKVEKNYTKEEIIEFYVNAPYLGSGSYGVEQASQTFFGKSVKDLSLVEAATIAGLFQAPGAYDPYVYPEKAQERRDQVLSLMERHGYITSEEKEIAEEIPVESYLNTSGSANPSLNKYQGFVDTVVQEVIDKTGNNPYDASMEIYTTMDRSKQDAINDLYAGKTYTFVDNKVQLGITAIDNETGAIVAVGAGRNKTKELSFNYATMTDKHPGSTAKPIFDYGPGFECEKWSTYTPFFDEPTTYSGGDSINNWDRSYQGMLTLKDALSRSRNTTALQAFRETSNECKVKFVKALGIRAEFGEDDVLHEAHSIGAFTGASPTELAAAYSAFANGGYYTEPYSYTKIVYKDSGKEVEVKPKKERAMSAETAYLITNVLVSATSHNRVYSTQVATKTGTSSYEEEALRKHNVPSSAIQSSWVSFYSPGISVTFWYGYDKLSSDYYLTMDSASYQRGLIQDALTAGLVEENGKFTRPSSIVSSEVELETIPALKPSEYTPASLRGTFLFIKGSEPTETSTRFSKLNNVTNLNVSKTGNTAKISWSKVKTPDFADKSYLQNYFKTGYKSYATKYYNKRISYNNAYMGNFGYDVYVKVNGSLRKIGFTTNNSYTFDIPSGTTAVVVKTAYSKFKTNASSGVEKSLQGATIDITVNGDGKTLKVGDTFIDEDPPVSIDADGTTIDPTEYEVTISEIKRSDGKVVTIDTLTEEAGTYTITYKITYNSNTYTETKTIEVTE